MQPRFRVGIASIDGSKVTCALGLTAEFAIADVADLLTAVLAIAALKPLRARFTARVTKVA